MSFVGELGRRNVIRVAIAYALVAWLVMQVADIVLEIELDNHLTGNWAWYLRTPLYDPVRENPRFVAMWAEFERRMAEQLAEFRRREKAKRGFEF